MPEPQPDHGQHLGLDLGGTNIKWAVVERDAGVVAVAGIVGGASVSGVVSGANWTVVDQGQVPTEADGGPTHVTERLAGLASRGLERFPALATVGIGVPGLYDPRSGVTRMLPNLVGVWDGVPVASYVSGQTGRPTHLTNDARAFGLAELRLGAGRGASCMVGVTLGTGVGGVIAVDGQIVQGHDGTAGEIGHQVMAVDGLDCTCGGRGCLEAYARADRIEALCGTSSVEEAIDRARAGDERAVAGLADVFGYLGIGVANMVVTLTPDRVVIGGGISAAGEMVLEPIRRTIRERVFTTDVDRVAVVTAQLGTWAGAIGAAIHGAERSAVA